MSDQTKYLNKLQNDRILVLGGSSGIGYAVVEALLEHNVKEVVIASSNAARVQSSIEKLNKSYPSKAGRTIGFACNLADEAKLESNIETLLKQATQTGKLDHIVYTSGDALAMMEVSQLNMDVVKQAGMVRFFAPIMLLKHAKTYMNPGPASSVTLTSGTVSERPIPGWAVVCSYATGLHGITKGFALDLKPLRVNLVLPGGVETPLWDGLPAQAREGIMQEMVSRSTTGAIGHVVDVAESYLYCIKDKNVSGTLIDTNSGALLL